MREPLSRYATLMFAVCMSSAATDARASTVVSMNVPTMSDYAAQVIVADVVSVTPRWAEQPKRIESIVRLENIEYWKGGSVDAPTAFDLTVPGGQIGTKRMRICCAPEYKPGEKWVLFLLPQYKTVPTVGLGQGAFRIEKDATGVAHVFQMGAIPVTGIDSEGWLQSEFGERVDLHERLIGSSANIRLRTDVATSNAKSGPPLSLEAFRNAIQPTLDASRDHGLRVPAGRYVPTIYHSTTIKSVGDGAAKNNATAIQSAKRRGDDVTQPKSQPVTGPKRQRFKAPQHDDSKSNATEQSRSHSSKSNKPAGAKR